jgi:hypothetical protein
MHAIDDSEASASQQERRGEEKARQVLALQESWEREKTLFAVHAAAWEDLRGMAATLFTARLAESGDSPLTRRPPWSMRLPVLGEPPAHLVCRPRFTSPRKRTGQPGQMHPEEVEVELMVSRARLRSDGKETAGWELRALLSPGKATYSGGSVRFGAEGIERASAAVSAFVTDPVQAMALSANHCCLCGRALTDERSRSRGVGPECVRFLNHLVQTYSYRAVRKVLREQPALF